MIALPGEKLEVRGKKVFINGKRITEDYGDIRWKFGGVRSFGPVTVPPEHVLVLGDNRDESKDSRYWANPFQTGPDFLFVFKIDVSVRRGSRAR